MVGVSLMTISQFAEHVGKSAVTIRWMCRQGRMPGAVRPGNEWLIDPRKASRAVYNGRGRPATKRRAKR